MTPASADWTGARWWLSAPDEARAPVAPLTVGVDLDRLALPVRVVPLDVGEAPPEGVQRRHWVAADTWAGWVECDGRCLHAAGPGQMGLFGGSPCS